MTATSDFINAVGSLLRPVGFKKAGSTWRLITDDVIVVLNIQKSQFDSAHFVNVGFWIRSLGDDMKPKPELCHVRGRAEGIWPDLGSQVVELMNIPDTDVLDESRASAIQQIFRDRIVPLLEKGASSQGLSELVRECGGLQVRKVAWPIFGIKDR